jgi:hypothetical protein
MSDSPTTEAAICQGCGARLKSWADYHPKAACDAVNARAALRATRPREFGPIVVDPEEADDTEIDPEQGDLVGCEHCGKSVDIEDAVCMVDCYYCKDCTALWDAHFKACHHEWEPAHEDGEDGRLCRKCSGFVAN